MIEDLIKDGNKIIFATSFGYGDAMMASGGEVPGRLLRARHGRRHQREPAAYFGAGEDTIYLAGIAAGAASESGTIGFVAPFPIPEVIRHINAFILGAQADQPQGHRQGRLDQHLVRPGQGAQGG